MIDLPTSGLSTTAPSASSGADCSTHRDEMLRSCSTLPRQRATDLRGDNSAGAPVKPRQQRVLDGEAPRTYGPRGGRRGREHLPARSPGEPQPTATSLAFD